MSTIRINELDYSYNDNCIFSDLNYYLKKDKSLSIIGPSGSGKTTLLKLLNGELEYDGNISISGVDVDIDNKNKINEKLAVVYDIDNFVNEKVIDELRYALENINMNPKDISEKINELYMFFDIKRIINKPISILSTKDKALVKILSYAIYGPEYIGLDDLLGYFDERTKLLLLNYFNFKGIRLINVTSNIEDIIYTDYTICLYDKIIAIEGKSLDVVKEEKLLKRLGLSLPFYVDLSIQLKLYGLINKICLSKEELVSNIWR